MAKRDKKPAAPAAPKELDMASLEALPGGKEENAAPPDDGPAGKLAETAAVKPKTAKKPARKNVIKGKAPMFSDADKSKALGIAAAVVCVAGLVFFVGWQAIAGMRENMPAQTVPDTPQAEAGTEDAQPSGASGAEAVSGGGTAWDSPLDRAPWDYKLADDEGDPATDGSGGSVESGTRYWVRGRDGTSEYKIVVPAGYAAYDMEDHVEIMREGASMVDGNEPLELWWRSSAEVRILLESGKYDALERTGTTGYDAWDITADSYYMFMDEDGNEWPVVTATLRKIESSGERDAYYEYWLVVGKKSNDGKYLVGAVPASGFQSLSTQICPDMAKLARALFPASSEPGMPAAWTQAPAETQPVETQPAQETDGQPVN